MSTDEQTDEQLMRAYVGGDADAFRTLFARLAPMLLRIAQRQLGRTADAQDVVQQTFLQLHRARLEFDARAHLKPWVVTIALNLARDLLRRRGRWGEAQVDEERLPAEPPAALAASGDADTAARVRAALAKLNADQRQVIELHWFEEMSFGDIAQVVGKNPGAVRVRAHRGYEALRKILGSIVPADE